MNRCCTRAQNGAAAVPAHPWPRRARALAGWAVPVAVLAVVPKCPVCLAAYVLLFTGVGLSLPVAAVVRWTVIAVCGGALLFLAGRAVVRRLRAGV